CMTQVVLFFFSSRRRHTRLVSDWNSDVCSSDLEAPDTMIRISPPVSSAGEGMPLLRSPGASPEPRKPRVLKGIQSQLMLMTRLRSEERRVGKECRSECARYRERKKAQKRIDVCE